MLILEAVVGIVIVLAVLAVLLAGIAWSRRAQLEQEQAPQMARLGRVVPLGMAGVGHAELREAWTERRAS